MREVRTAVAERSDGLAGAIQQPLVNRKSLQTNRSARVDFAGGDADLSAKPETEAVRKSGGGIPEDIGGVYAALATASLSAKANKNFVFAGWLDGEGGEFVEDDRFDYRNPSLKLSVTEDVATMWFASFASSEADGKVEIVGEFDDGDMFYVDPNDQETAFSLAYSVTSVSLPTVKVSGLPAGFEASTSASFGLFTIAYDPSTAKKKPAPGDYLVKVTATNVSKASDTAEFTIRAMSIKASLKFRVKQIVIFMFPKIHICKGQI